MKLPVEILDKYEIDSVISEERSIYTVISKEIGDKCFIKKIPCKYEKTYGELLNNMIDGIPRIKEIIKIDKNTVFVVEQFVSGQELIKFIEGNKERINEAWIFGFIFNMADILISIEKLEKPIRHGEISGSNIIISYDDKPYLFYFDNNIDKKDEKSDIFQLGEVVQLIKNKSGVNSSILDLFISKCKHLDPEKGFNNASMISVFIKEQIAGSKKKESDDKSLYKGKVLRFLPPGFRTGYLWKMITAVIGYLCCLGFAFAYECDSNDIRILYINRICIFLALISVVFFNNDYLGIQKHFNIPSEKKDPVRLVLLAFWDVVLIAVFVGICVMLENALK